MIYYQEYEHAFTITPDNSADIHKTRGLSITDTTQKNVAVIMAGGQTVTLALAPGVIHPVQVTRVLVTDTTATGVIGYY